MKNKFTNILLSLTIMIISGCTINKYSDDRLLTGDKYLTNENFIEYIKSRSELISDEFFLYNLSFFSILCGSSDLPSGETEYLFIPKSKDSRGYFELYRYSDYSEVIRLEDITDSEYEIINRKFDDIKNNSIVDCDRVHEYSMGYGFTFYFNITKLNKKVSAGILLDSHMVQRRKYLCLQTYLNSVLFMRELDYYGNRRLRE